MSFGNSPVTVLPLHSTSSQYPVRRGSSPFLLSSYAALTNGSTKDSSIAVSSGLTPPPSATMSTTYHQQLAAYDSYGNAHLGSFGPASSSSSTKPTMADPRSAQHHRGMHQHQHQQQPSSSSYSHASTMSQSTNPFSQGSQRSSRPTTPGSQDSSLQASKKAAAEGLIYHSLCIPKCITPKGGNLADFAAQMTCLFWFQDLEDLQFAENIRSFPPETHVEELKPLARPQENFRKWVYSILSTTQVTQNVILLALLFVYRLKKSTPQIKGRTGSEYRLLTVALMLGNKFLDDNTYTNKTWAEVSSFKVGEIHVMEVEFLSNMRYNLLASKAEWEDWLTKLACFYEYHERANRPRNPSPSRLDYTSPVSSPAATSFYDMPPVTPTGPKHISPTSSRSQVWNPYMANTTSPLAAKPAMPPTQSRKRSRDDRVEEHPAKRHMPPNMAYNGPPPVDARLNARLPVPQLSVNTNPAATTTQMYSAAPSGYATSQVPVALPPIQRTTRSMASVYAQNNAHPSNQYAGAVAPVPAGIPYSGIPMGASQPPSMHGTPSKRRSPGTLAPFASSPLVDAYGVGSAMQTPLALTPVANSPSVYLQHRNSPYKPIRDVRTLLHPGPSASLDQYHLHAPVPPNQMHYQPLGRRYDLRTGIVPEFVRYHLAQQHQQPPPITPATAGHVTGYMGQYAP